MQASPMPGAPGTFFKIVVACERALESAIHAAGAEERLKKLMIAGDRFVRKHRFVQDYMLNLVIYCGIISAVCVTVTFIVLLTCEMLCCRRRRPVANPKPQKLPEK